MVFFLLQGDNLDRFGWLKHDGVSFGVQELIDRGVNITTSFVKQLGTKSIDKGGSWSNRVQAKLSRPDRRLDTPQISYGFAYVLAQCPC